MTRELSQLVVFAWLVLVLVLVVDRPGRHLIVSFDGCDDLPWYLYWLAGCVFRS